MPHTPGPWAFTEGNKQQRGMSDVFLVADPEFRIGYVTCESHNEKQRAEDIANARLIAAAPELLEACEMALGALAVLSTATYDGKMGDVLRAAIAKATT